MWTITLQLTPDFYTEKNISHVLTDYNEFGIEIS
jgi:hypothetical protein